jgi:hypothetical protein
MNELTQHLNNIGNTTWFFNAFSLLMLYYLGKNLTAKSSNLLTLIIIVVFNTLMLGYQGILDWYRAANLGVSAVVNFFWYMGFAIFDLIAMRAIYNVHKKENVRIGRLGQYASFAFFAVGTLQLLQYAEIVIFNTNDKVATLYIVGIPSINIATAIICTVVALFSLYTSLNIKKA